MIVLRYAGGFALGLLLASCSSLDTSKYALSNRDASAPPVQFSRADINPDGTLVNPYPVSAQRGSAKKYVFKEVDRSQRDVTPTPTPAPTPRGQQEGPNATSDIGRHAIKIGASSQQSDEPTTTGTLSGRTRPQLLTPVIGSDSWKKEEAENEKLDKQLDALLKTSICKCQ